MIADEQMENMLNDFGIKIDESVMHINAEPVAEETEEIAETPQEKLANKLAEDLGAAIEVQPGKLVITLPGKSPKIQQEMKDIIKTEIGEVFYGQVDKTKNIWEVDTSAMD
jgi:D-lyxose ketol-isomerase